eukprot:254960-Prymnesium_polylepis.1
MHTPLGRAAARVPFAARCSPLATRRHRSPAHPTASRLPTPFAPRAARARTWRSVASEAQLARCAAQTHAAHVARAQRADAVAELRDVEPLRRRSSVRQRRHSRDLSPARRGNVIARRKGKNEATQRGAA